MKSARLAGIAMLVVWLAGAAAWQGKEKPAEICPWCKNDPELMRAAGTLSHGPIPIGPKGSEHLAATYPASQWLFLETAHLRWASALGSAPVDIKDKERVQVQLERLRKVLPDVPPKVKKLDPWLRLHLFAMRGEEFYARFQQLLGVTDADFPEARTPGKPYMGNGRFLGEKDKFEVVIHATRATHLPFTLSFTGAGVNDSLRWHFKDEHKLIASVPAEDPDLRQDRWLFAHVVHNLAHLFLCAYKHFSYDPPIWLDEGLAHAMEKEIEPESNTSDGDEGTFSDTKGPSDWHAAARRLLAAGKTRSLAELIHLKDFGSFDQDASITAWSMVRFFADAHPAEFARFLGGVKGQLDAQGYPSGKDLPDLQRRLLKEIFGWTPAQFEEAWKVWLAAPR